MCTWKGLQICIQGKYAYFQPNILNIFSTGLIYCNALFCFIIIFNLPCQQNSHLKSKSKPLQSFQAIILHHWYLHTMFVFWSSIIEFTYNVSQVVFAQAIVTEINLEIFLHWSTHSNKMLGYFRPSVWSKRDEPYPLGCNFTCWVVLTQNAGLF